MIRIPFIGVLDRRPPGGIWPQGGLPWHHHDRGVDKWVRLD